MSISRHEMSRELHMRGDANHNSVTAGVEFGERAFAQSVVKGETDDTSKLLQLADLGDELGAKNVAADSRVLAARLSEGRFYLACIGQFKRGKSTLINALLGERILPVGFVPVTTVPTMIRYGPTKKGRVQFQDSSWQDIEIQDLDQYVSEEQNPENKKGV